SGIDKSDLANSIYEVLVGEATATQAIVKTPGEYDLLPANGDLTAAEVELLAVDNRETRLREILATVDDQYDFVVIDCPPSLNMLTINAMVAAQGVIIPMQCEDRKSVV